ncbi:Uncharacterized protein Fot_48371 [Forsythia ovata]|uniref:Uncharacterized protein n=1 Tax=Forsythia ovata TaxID=205694 RepID=A0ABD1Q8U7_9LAMI
MTPILIDTLDTLPPCCTPLSLRPFHPLTAREPLSHLIVVRKILKHAVEEIGGRSREKGSWEEGGGDATVLEKRVRKKMIRGTWEDDTRNMDAIFNKNKFKSFHSTLTITRFFKIHCQYMKLTLTVNSLFYLVIHVTRQLNQLYNHGSVIM